MHRKFHRFLIFIIISLILLPIYSKAIKIESWSILNFPGSTGVESTEEVPDFYGYYILKGGEWVEIPRMFTEKKTCLKGVCSSWGIHGLITKPELVSDDLRPTIIIYEKGLNIDALKLVRLWYFEQLRAVDFHGSPPDPGFFRSLCGVRRENLCFLGLWTPVGTYPHQIGPVPNHPDMYRIRAKEKLPPGIYAVSQSKNFTSRPMAGDFHILIRAFQIRGLESKSTEPPPLFQTPVKIVRTLIAEGLDQGENPVGIKTHFLVSTQQIVGYMDVKETRGGEVIDLIWLRPDRSVHVQDRITLSSPRPGKVQYVYSRFKPANLLMPGTWVFAIKINGDLVRWKPFHVSVK